MVISNFGHSPVHLKCTTKVNNFIYLKTNNENHIKKSSKHIVKI